MVAPLSSWPWENLGIYKYILYGPIIGKVVYTKLQQGTIPVDWCLHILLLCFLRIAIYCIWSAFSNMLFINKNRRISQQGYDFKQVDREWDWDNLIILQALIAAVVCCYSQLPFFDSVPLWNARGLMAVLLIHVAVSEPLYYWFHRLLHTSYLFTHYHSIRHSSPCLHPFTGANATFLEQLGTTAITMIPLIGAYSMGYGSKSIVYLYILAFDFLRCFGNSNVELVPYKLFETIPLLKYVISTPTYHSLHQEEMSTNFCLFMPIFDAIWKTRNPKSWQLHKEITSKSGEGVVPDFVFLAHVVDVTCSMHAPFVFRAFASVPYRTRLFLLPCWPFAFAAMLMLWAWAKAFHVSFYNLRGRLHHTWAVPRYGFQYFLPFAKEGINNRIEEAILKADKIGVKVISLAALNKNEALNGGGTLFVNKHPDLRARVVHGNTLTAAVILNEIPKYVTEVFLTGATSKLGRAIALYLCRKRVRVLMLTLAAERFQKIQKEAPAEFQQYLVQVTKYQAAQSCKTWIVGKWITPREQNWAPKGTHFHQFVVPPILSFRRDCTYGDLAAMRLPDDVQGLASCEYTMDRGVVHACHAGGVVHFLEGYTHHEVGAIDVDRIDVVWNAAMKHGLKPV